MDFSFGFWVFSQIVIVSVIVPRSKVFLTFRHAYVISDISLRMKVAPKKVIERLLLLHLDLFKSIHCITSTELKVCSLVGFLVHSSAVLTAAPVALGLIRATTFCTS